MTTRDEFIEARLREELDLAANLRDWSLAGCEHTIRMDEGRTCSPCLRDRLLASDWLAARVAAERDRVLANERERITRAVVEHADHMETYTLPALQPGFIDGWTHALRLLRRDADSIASRAAIKEARDE